MLPEARHLAEDCVTCKQADAGRHDDEPDTVLISDAPQNLKHASSMARERCWGVNETLHKGLEKPAFLPVYFDFYEIRIAVGILLVRLRI
jgi:hypothetical protein